jgi:protein CpxP
MKIKSQVIGLALLVPLSVTGVAYAKGGQGPDEMFGRCANPGQLIEQLALTDAQKVQFFDLKTQKREERKEMRGEKRGQKGMQREASAQMKTLHESMEKLTMADTFDEAAAKQLVEKMEAIRQAQREDNRTDRMVDQLKKEHEVMAILSDAQKQKFTELKATQMSECMPHDGKNGKNDKKGKHGGFLGWF